MSANPASDSSLPAEICNWWREQSNTLGFWRTARALAGALGEFLRESTPSRRRQRYGDMDYDWEHRVDTTGATVPWRERLLGCLHSPYQPSEESVFREVLEQLRIDFTEFTFIDLGSGKGRTLLMAADYPFEEIIGVELLPGLHRIAEENLAKYKSDSQRCFTLKSLCVDARGFSFPKKPTVLYFFNPFPEWVLVEVIQRFGQSLQEFPRPAYVVYMNPEHDAVLANANWLRKIASTQQYSIYAASER